MICSRCKNIVPAGRTACIVCGTTLGDVRSPSSALPTATYAPQNASRPFSDASSRRTRNWILGIVGAVIVTWVIAWIVLFSPVAPISPIASVVPAAPPEPASDIATLDPAAIEANIHDDILAQRSYDLTIACPSLMEGVQGTSWQCIGEDSVGTRYLINVRLRTVLGDIVWELQP